MSTKTVNSVFSNGGFTSTVTPANGTDFAFFPTQSCKQLTISNNTGVTVEIQQNNNGFTFPVLPYSYFTLAGITDASNISVRRVDVSTNQILVNARWEA